MEPMGHHELICRSCGDEWPISSMRGTGGGGGGGGFVCGTCGGTAFGV